MSRDDDSHAELMRKFEAAIAGAELDDLRRLAGDLLDVAGERARRAARPELRRPALEEVRTLRVRVELDDSDPAIWRTVDLRSDLMLDAVHEVLQTLFGWADSHLHRFALGGHPFAPTSQLFLCPFDVQEGEDDGTPVGEVRLDEVLQEPGDELRYLYDYGDSWELTLRVEEVLSGSGDSPPAALVDGDRAAPPEDSGGASDLASLAFVVDDPAHFDRDEVEAALQASYGLLDSGTLDPRLRELLQRLRARGHRALEQRLPVLLSGPTDLPAEQRTAALAPVRWFLDRAVGDGITLTGAGYLKPDDVQAAAALLPMTASWPVALNREVHTRPLLEFREALRSPVGLLRKKHGVLVLTQAGAAAQQDDGRLWRHLTDRLVPGKPTSFEYAASLLLLAYVGSSPDGRSVLDEVAAALTVLGWQLDDGAPVEGHHLYRLPALVVLENIGTEPIDVVSDYRFSHAATTLARATLRRD